MKFVSFSDFLSPCSKPRNFLKVVKLKVMRHNMKISLKTFTLMLITDLKKSKTHVASVYEATQEVTAGQFAPLTQIPHKEETPAVLPQRSYSKLLSLALSPISSSFSTLWTRRTGAGLLSAFSPNIYANHLAWFLESGGKIFGTSWQGRKYRFLIQIHSISSGRMNSTPVTMVSLCLTLFGSGQRTWQPACVERRRMATCVHRWGGWTAPTGRLVLASNVGKMTDW